MAFKPGFVTGLAERNVAKRTLQHGRRSWNPRDSFSPCLKSQSCNIERNRATQMLDNAMDWFIAHQRLPVLVRVLVLGFLDQAKDRNRAACHGVMEIWAY